uniref:DNA-binding protein n=1 Tax=Eiseniibacteriota bacterium TaxID=2212470 RepID=A0A832ML03_UNCEI
MPIEINAVIARRLDETAALAEEQGANRFRVAAYRHAAALLRGLDRSVADILARDGEKGLMELPGIGESLARSIRIMVETGRLPMLERLRGESGPELLLQSVPGIGRKLAERLHHDHGIDTLEELEAALLAGRLAGVPGLGGKRAQGVLDSLAARLGRVRRATAPAAGEAPPVGELLDVDREYRARAARGELPTIAPRRMNPTGAKWLPVLHTTRGARHYTALFSNTARAHQMNATRDWVVLYWDAPDGERQCTVITSRLGALRGRRIVRGREDECAAWYRRARAGTARDSAG